MNTERIEKDDGRLDLSQYMAEVIDELKEDRRYPAVHTYTSTLHSFAKFSCGAMPVNDVFTPGRLKAYEDSAAKAAELEHHFHLYAHLAGGI